MLLSLAVVDCFWGGGCLVIVVYLFNSVGYILLCLVRAWFDMF